MRSPFVLRFKFGEIEDCSLFDIWAMYRYKMAVRLRNWINEVIGRIDSSGAVLRMTTADDYRRMKEFREEKAHRLKFPRIMYHLVRPSIVVRNEKEAGKLVVEGYDYRPVFTEPSVPAARIAALQESAKQKDELIEKKDLDLRKWAQGFNNLDFEKQMLLHEVRSLREKLALSVLETAQPVGSGMIGGCF